MFGPSLAQTPPGRRASRSEVICNKANLLETLLKMAQNLATPLFVVGKTSEVLFSTYFGLLSPLPVSKSRKSEN
jgi:hypothetical protein